MCGLYVCVCLYVCPGGGQNVLTKSPGLSLATTADCPMAVLRFGVSVNFQVQADMARHIQYLTSKKTAAEFGQSLSVYLTFFSMSASHYKLSLQVIRALPCVDTNLCPHIANGKRSVPSEQFRR